MSENRNQHGYPMLERVQQQAAEIRARNFPAPCQCATCVSVRNLPAVQRILALWQPMDKLTKEQ